MSCDSQPNPQRPPINWTPLMVTYHPNLAYLTHHDHHSSGHRSWSLNHPNLAYLTHQVNHSSGHQLWSLTIQSLLISLTSTITHQDTICVHLPSKPCLSHPPRPSLNRTPLMVTYHPNLVYFTHPDHLSTGRQ